MGKLTGLSMRPRVADTTDNQPAESTPVAKPAEGQQAKPPTPHRLRAALELAGAWGLEYLGYWADNNANSPDRDLDLSPMSAIRKIFVLPGSHAFDTNPMMGNIRDHPFSAAVWTVIGRENGLSYLGTQGVTCLMSHLGESIGELPEKAADNDEANTCLPGQAIGESIFQMHRFLQENDYALGKLSKNWHRFDVSAGVGATKDPSGARASSQLSLNAEVMNDATYGKAGAQSRWYNDGLGGELHVSTATSRRGFEDFHFLAKALPIGHLTTDAERQADGTLSGYSSYIGYGNGYEVDFTQPSAGRSSDRIASMNQGITAKGQVSTHGLTLGWNADLAVDFAELDPYGFDQAKPSGTIMSVLARSHYYYAGGGTARLALSAEDAGFSLGAHAQADIYESFNGEDRFPQKITNHLRLTDTRLRAGAEAAYSWGKQRLALDLDWQRRSGSIVDSAGQDARLSGSDEKAMLSFGLKL